MGSWVYCTECDAGLDHPTLKEILTEDYTCSNCGADSHTGYTKEEALGLLADKIEEMEAKLLKLNEGKGEIKTP